MMRSNALLSLVSISIFYAKNDTLNQPFFQNLATIKLLFFLHLFFSESRLKQQLLPAKFLTGKVMTVKIIIDEVKVVKEDFISNFDIGNVQLMLSIKV